jgi:hypothetical protein
MPNHLKIIPSKRIFDRPQIVENDQNISNVCKLSKKKHKKWNEKNI